MISVGRTVIVFVGPAGASKSSLIYAYSKWLEESFGYKVYKINLDPAAEYIPYTPDFDVRSIVDAHKVVIEYGLGPNGALVKSMDILANKMEIIEAVLRRVTSDFVLIDTSGQMEIFIFRDIAIKLVDVLRKASRESVVIFVIDADIIRRYEDYAFIAIMSVAIQARLGIDVVPIINKVDLAPRIDITGDVVSDVDVVAEKLKKLGTYGEMLSGVLNTIWLYAKATRVPKVSAKTMENIEELHRVVHELTCACGDLT
ncbi:MAG: ATP/GTP-binding protein [Ignisphaera sp.]